ncbi:hypothetical protein G6F68_012998 [Rhizopus microsporus]|nr:hypothetical protein G6F68_012998 [Rhizopus microsporus]
MATSTLAPHALEAEGRLGVAAVIFGQARHRGLDGLLQFLAQAFGVGPTGLQNGLGGRVVEQCQQQVLDGNKFVPGRTGLDESHMQADFKLLRNHASSVLHRSGQIHDSYSMPIMA